MTQVLPHSPQPVAKAVRKPLTPLQRSHLAMSQGGLCAGCGGPLGADWEADHDIPLWISGKDTGHVALCRFCHRTVKTPADLRTIAHLKRILARMTGERRARRPILGRGFEKAGNKHRWPKRLFPPRQSKGEG